MSSAKEIVIDSFNDIRKGTKFILNAIPEDKLNHAVNGESATIGDLAFHISTMPLGTTLFAQGKFDKFPEESVLMETFEEYLGEALTENDFPTIWEKSCEIFLEYWKGKTADEWLTSTYSHFLTRGPRTYLEGFLAMQNHILQHRGSLTSTLRSADIPVTFKQYWGMAPLEK